MRWMDEFAKLEDHNMPKGLNLVDDDNYDEVLERTNSPTFCA
jgi:hypothetical protein